MCTLITCASLMGLGASAWAQSGTPRREPPERTTTPPSRSTPESRRPKVPSETTPSGGQQISLRPKFTKGRLSRYEMSITSDNNLRVDGATTPQKQEMSQTINLAVTVSDVGEDGATLDIVYERMRATVDSGGFKSSFDSHPTGAKPSKPTKAPSKPRKATKPAAPVPESPDAEPLMEGVLEEIMRPMVGTKLTMKVDRDGNIKSVSGGDALGGAGLAALMGGGVPTVNGGGGSNPMSWVVNSPGQKPDVRVGESWTNTDQLGGTPVGGFKMVTRHTCNSVQETQTGKVAHLIFNGRADQDSESGGAGSGFKLKESAYDGKYEWDLGAGELKSMTSTLRTKIESRLVGRGTEMDANTRMSVRRID
ncbi:MAG: hypothetical protein IT438_13880 [Phycisphaerales bacterium]|nr:hypothetical protein [Phycisphaerales bacterium]